MKARRGLFLTEYRTGGARYGCWVLARDEKEAARVCRRRGLGERVIGRKSRRVALDDLPSYRFAQPRRHRRSTAASLAINRLHAVTFLAHIALAARVSKPKDFTDDATGLIHQTVHAHIRSIRGRGHWNLREIERRMRAVERRIPGWGP